MPPNCSSHVHDQTVMAKKQIVVAVRFIVWTKNGICATIPVAVAAASRWSWSRRRFEKQSPLPTGQVAKQSLSQSSRCRRDNWRTKIADLASSVTITQVTVCDLRPLPRGSPFSSSSLRLLTIVALADGSRSGWPPVKEESVTEGANQRNMGVRQIRFKDKNGKK